MKINNRRYTGSKFKLMPWIKSLILENCPQHDCLFDVFGGTGVVTAELLDVVQSAIINDFLYSNEVIYKAFFQSKNFNKEKLNFFVDKYLTIDYNSINENYISKNFGGKYFNYDDAKKIGFIRQDIQDSFQSNVVTEHEFNILLASLLYSLDRCANTVGHYEAYIKKAKLKPSFRYELIEPISTEVEITVVRQNSNELAKKIECDVAFVDPPYNSRQYSRFYHLLETVTKWDEPELSGVALKPPEENMSEYCRSNAPLVFKDLIQNLNAKYIVVTYNNTYNSRSSSSRNKIKLSEIEKTLRKKGNVHIFTKEHQRFNAGKTAKTNHKEILFITKVNR